MIIVLRPESTEAQIQHILERIAELGFKPHISRGEMRTIIGVIGDETKLVPEPLQAIPGVEQVLAIMKPFKLASREFNKKDTVVTEVMDPRQIPLVERYADMFQIGARNMQNFDLLKEIGQTKLPVLLKRGMSATVKDLIMSAEYILSSGNPNVVL